LLIAASEEKIVVQSKYGVFFITAGLMRNETLLLAGLYSELNDWEQVRSRVLAENILQYRTQSTTKKTCREIIARLQTLSRTEFDFFLKAARDEQGCLLWLMICRRYEIIADFAIEVLREGYIAMKKTLYHSDFDVFFDRKAKWHSGLDKIALGYRKKMRQVLFRILREADIIDAENNIKPVLPGSGLRTALNPERRQDLLFLPGSV
jgi:hypothetical protein